MLVVVVTAPTRQAVAAARRPQAEAEAREGPTRQEAEGGGWLQTVTGLALMSGRVHPTFSPPLPSRSVLECVQVVVGAGGLLHLAGVEVRQRMVVASASAVKVEQVQPAEPAVQTAVQTAVQAAM